MSLLVAFAGLLLVGGAPSGVTAAPGAKVAPFVVSPERDVQRMLDLADLGPEDYLVDLGAGDGRIVVAAGERGALAHGVEIDPELVRRARDRAREAGVSDRVAFVQGDLFEADFRHASVVTLYLFPDANLRLRPLLLEQLEPGTRVLSNSFDMGEWSPDVHVESATNGGILMWIIPARVAGDWELRIGADRHALRLLQSFQDVSGELGPESPGVPLMQAALRGARIRFDAELDGVRHRFSGRIDDDVMTGTVQVREADGIRIDAWTAIRKGSAEDP